MAGFADRLKNFFGLGKQVSEELFEDLADLLVEGDFGAAFAFKTVDALRGLCKKEGLSDPAQVRSALAGLLEAGLCPPPENFTGTGELTVILLRGVNGVGKTTTAAKLADRYRAKKPILAAADTFRAAAVDQLRIHGERLGIRVVAHKQGGDPAAVVYDALLAARAGGGNMFIADTAGWMHTKAALLEELKKLDRVVESRAPDAGYIRWLVLDSTTGRNALAQAETFQAAVALDGVILTKFDSSARGGVVFSLSAELSLPVVFICNGEKYGDIKPFDPKEYTKEFIGLE
jgi:fused signal recognition particle receptor